MLTKTRTYALLISLLLLSYGLMLSSLRQKSATVDEQSHLLRGVAYVQAGATHFLWGHPLLASSLNALPLLTEPDLRLPVSDPAWESEQWWLAADAFMWRINDEPLRLLFLGRLATVWLTLLVGAGLYRWGREWGGREMALFVSALWLLDPNVLAHGRVITSDIALTLFFLLTIYGLWRYAQTKGKAPWVAPWLLTGIGLGGAWATKFSAAALLPMLGLLGLWLVWRWRSWRPVWFGLGVAGLAVGVVTAVYRFNPTPFLADLAWQFDYFAQPHGAFLLGDIYTGGHWLYFPIAFLTKTSLLVLFLTLVGLIFALTGRGAKGSETIYFWLPILVYAVISLLTPLNIGYRHLLPLLPFLYLWLGAQINHREHREHREMLEKNSAFSASSAVHFLKPSVANAEKAKRGMVGLLLLISLLLLGQLRTWPHYLPHFNLLVGQNGWHILSDSNLDWGQDLPALAEWQAAHPDEPLYFSYFGMARPSVYGLRYTALPTWPPAPEQAYPFRQAFYPPDPAPGVYALSVTNLQGVVLGEQAESFAYFRPKEPRARLGESIWLYEVAPYGEPVDVVLSGLLPADLPAEWVAAWGTNQRRVRWVEASRSMVWPREGGWLVVPEGVEPLWGRLATEAEAVPVAVAAGQRLYALPALPREFEGEAMGEALLFVDMLFEEQLLTAWQTTAVTDRPLKIFVHLLDEQGEIIAQWDGLDVWPGSWQVGDLFVQAHDLAVPAELDGFSWLIGVYDGETGERLGEKVISALRASNQ